MLEKRSCLIQMHCASDPLDYYIGNCLFSISSICFTVMFMYHLFTARRFASYHLRYWVQVYMLIKPCLKAAFANIAVFAFICQVQVCRRLLSSSFDTLGRSSCRVFSVEKSSSSSLWFFLGSSAISPNMWDIAVKILSFLACTTTSV